MISGLCFWVWGINVELKKSHHRNNKCVWFFHYSRHSLLLEISLQLFLIEKKLKSNKSTSPKKLPPYFEISDPFTLNPFVIESSCYISGLEQGIGEHSVPTPAKTFSGKFSRDFQFHCIYKITFLSWVIKMKSSHFLDNLKG